MHNFIENMKPKWKSFRESMYLLAKNKLSLVAFIIIILFIGMAIFAPVIAPYPEDVYSTHISEKLLPPSAAHLMGTDELGRDVFSRV
ncbi:MAG: D,D-dipeptide ABC transporter permease, partial [Lachnospiraceae bacterium]|nr:D,D-dipeptide ABC transporter permease [Lachnospiraceae bacterium]